MLPTPLPVSPTQPAPTASSASACDVAYTARRRGGSSPATPPSDVRRRPTRSCTRVLQWVQSLTYYRVITPSGSAAYVSRDAEVSIPTPDVSESFTMQTSSAEPTVPHLHFGHHASASPVAPP
eukprot:TRINITY_DN70934_c0_g1_i1.p1 TRINITY_DN70934_c0_g1~~TRINITY_DN70934_c0_g1_i1.p1  ORF type:complete len:123 (-),score=3.99 TRINITY_DN70934_c0_g1_i1:37-405(-)